MWNIDKQIESTLNCKNPLVWPQTAKTRAIFNISDYSYTSTIENSIDPTYEKRANQGEE